ncbi:lysine--tRNA ligase, partial [Bifidobacterium aemilianum]
MTDLNENADRSKETPETETAMSTVERAQMLFDQDQAIASRVKQGAELEEAIDPSNHEFGPTAHPEQVQMRVAKRALMIKEGVPPYPVHLNVTDRIEDVRAKYEGQL